jgi:hypothetical protein
MVLYTVLLAVGAVVAFVATRKHRDFEVGLLRLSGEPYTMEAGEVRNALQLHVVNKRSEATTYLIEVEPADGMTVVLPMPTVTLASLSDAHVPVFLSVPRERFHQSLPFRARVVRTGDARDEVLVQGTFLGPAR